MYLQKSNKTAFNQELNDFYNSKYIRKVLKLLIFPLFLFQRAWKKNIIQLPQLEIVVGSKCTLHCKRCANLMQYYPKQILLDHGQLVKDIKDLLLLNICIDRVNLIGGEPFLYKELPELIEFLISSPKIQTVRVVTNGTLIPSDKLLKVLRNKQVNVLISNYAAIGTKINEVFSLLKKEKIDVTIISNTWYDYQHNFDGYGRTETEIASIYQNCAVDCHEMFNGEIHLCPTSAHGMYLGLIPRDEKSFVSVRHDHTKKGIKEVENKLKELICHQIPNACAYCSGNNGTVIANAEQLPPGTFLDRKGLVTAIKKEL